MSEHVNLLDVITKDREMPEGYDTWAIRTVRPDFRSQYDYRYPYPGNVAEAPGPIYEDNDDPCPDDVGDGICAALTWAGMASGGVPALTLLLVAYRNSDVLAMSPDKLRLRRFLVVDVIDGARLLREQGTGADLRSAHLRSADLSGADLRSADLSGVHLSGADLSGADLRSADLSGAHLCSAHLYSADLRSADLSGADLSGADLSGADLRSAVNVTQSQIADTHTDRWTRLPSGLVVPA